ncbi:MAG: SDR family oxidoreductase [Proteobacteria bacterium]|nr:SDR family oxidoreductase [Pseudomonadota bacterium]
MTIAFNKRSTAEQVTEGVDLHGKVALVTGVNSGIGTETLRILALRGAHVIGTARTLEKARAGCSVAPDMTTPLACELTDLKSVRNCAEAVHQKFDRLDIIVANAGIMALPKLQQANGLEMQFATNHLGHFLLVAQLLGMLADDARVVMVSSEGHRSAPAGGIQFDNLSGEAGYSPLRAYGQSKLANILFAKALAKRVADGVAVSALHPGVIATNLGRHIPKWIALPLALVFFPMAKTVAQGAATSCLLATHPDYAGVKGSYFSDCKPASESAYAKDEELAERLWKVSEELCGTVVAI